MPRPGGDDAATGRPSLRVGPAADYELYAWDGGWTTVARTRAGDGPVTIDAVPGGRLCWLVRDGSPRLERIFTIEAGSVVGW